MHNKIFIWDRKFTSTYKSWNKYTEVLNRMRSLPDIILDTEQGPMRKNPFSFRLKKYINKFFNKKKSSFKRFFEFTYES